MREIQLKDNSTFLANEVRLEDGSLLSIFNDITDLKNQQSLNAKLKNAIDNVPIGIMFWDENDNLSFANDFAKNIQKGAGMTFDLGISYKEYTQRQKKNKFLKFENEDAENEYYNNVVENRKKVTGEVSVLTPEFYNGTFWNATSTRLNDGGLFSIFTNITELKKREEELNKTISELDIAREKADAANQTKSQFLANMSHELRTPLQSIKMGLETFENISDLKKNSEVNNLLPVMTSQSERMENLIRDLLSLSKIELQEHIRSILKDL